LPRFTRLFSLSSTPSGLAGAAEAEAEGVGVKVLVGGAIGAEVWKTEAEVGAVVTGAGTGAEANGSF